MEGQVSNQMLKMAKADPSRLAELRSDPLPALEKLKADAAEITQPVYMGDALLYRIAVVVLGSLAVIAAVGSLILVLGGKTTPEVLVALGSAAVGALVGLFAPSPTGK